MSEQNVNVNLEFDSWNEIKKATNLRPRVKFKEGDVFFMYLGKNIGHEQNGSGTSYVRPVIVLRKFNKKIFLGVPLTKKSKLNRYTSPLEIFNKKVSFALLTQIRLFDARRIQHKLITIDRKSLEDLRKAIRDRII